MNKNQEEKGISVEKMKKNIKKLQQIDKSLIPQYLDNVKKENNIQEKVIKNGEDNSFLKYLL